MTQTTNKTPDNTLTEQNTVERFVSKKFLEELNFLADEHGVVSIAYGEYGRQGKKFSIMTLDDKIRCVDDTIEGVVHKAFEIEFEC